MAEKIYTLEQAAAKLGKTPEEFKALAKNNKISELRKGADILYNAKDVDALATTGSDETVLSIEDSVIGLNDESSLLGLAPIDSEDDKGGDEFEIDADMSSMVELTEADTRAGMDGAGDKSAEDSVLTLADSYNDEPEAKINADADIASGAAADGSGSGLLDLSLQADDSQFGAVLDDILPGGDKDGGFDDFGDNVPSSGNAISEAEESVPTSELQSDESEDAYESEPAAVPSAAMPVAAGAAAVTYQQIESEDPASGTFGVMMLLPLLAVILAFIVISAGFKAVTPSILTAIEDYMMYVFGGLAALALIIGVVGSVGGSGGGEKKAKPVKAAKPKPAAKAKKKK